MMISMNDKLYDNDGLDQFLRELRDDLCEIKKQTIATNGRVSKLERYMLIVGTISATLLVVNGSEFVSFITSIL